MFPNGSRNNEGTDNFIGGRPKWHMEAACRGSGFEKWVLGQSQEINYLKAEAAASLCAGCTQQAACLAVAVSVGSRSVRIKPTASQETEEGEGVLRPIVAMLDKNDTTKVIRLAGVDTSNFGQ
jgi:hypothetical protein